MKNFLNIVLLILICIFFINTFIYYSSNQNIETKNYIRNNINQIINTKISNIPILYNDTNNVIYFKDGFSNEIKNDKPRNFWNLLKP